MLEKEQFLNIVKHAPLVSIDLVVRSQDNGVLMGMRLNQPAYGYWFVPGGVIIKNETIDAAFLRISKAELGASIDIENGRLIGVFTHLYDTNFANEPGVGTRYVVLAYELHISLNLETLPDEQHSNHRWIYQDDKIENVHENSTVYFSHLEENP